MRIFVITKRTLVIIGVLLAAVITAVILLLSFLPDAAAVSGPAVTEEYEMEVLAGQRKEVPVYSVDHGEKKIALTIDAAWEDDKTPYILDTLDRYNVKATFFLCGFWVDKYPQHIKEIAAAGHEIGNHSATHPHMNQLSAAQIQKELNDLEAMMVKLTGNKTKLFRAPFGEYNDTVITTVRSMGYEVVQWDLDTVDWRPERSAQTILDAVIPKLHPGCIILSHNNGYKIKEYLEPLIQTAQEQGYTFVTVSDLLLEGDTIVDVNGVQKKA